MGGLLESPAILGYDRGDRCPMFDIAYESAGGNQQICKMAILICYDLAFPNHARGWFRDDQEPRPEFFVVGGMRGRRSKRAITVFDAKARTFPRRGDGAFVRAMHRCRLVGSYRSAGAHH